MDTHLIPLAGFTPCYDQGTIDSFIYGIVELFENDGRVIGYAYTDGGGLGSAWLPTNNGQYGTGLRCVSAYVSLFQRADPLI